MITRRTFLSTGLPALAVLGPDADRRPPRRRRIPNPELVTHEGRTVRFYDDLLRGRVVTISFFYAECKGICSRTTTNLVRVQRLLGDLVGRSVFMYSLTLTPEKDGPEALAAYRDRYGIRDGWTLLTGRPDNVELVRRGLGFTDPDPAADADRSQHSGLVVYGSEALDAWGALPILSPASEIARAIRRRGRV
jgi:protein SCO1